MKDRDGTPLTRNTKALALVIAFASAVLVAASVVLMILRSPGDFSTVPSITRRTSAPSSSALSTPPPAPVTAPDTTSTTASTTPESPTASSSMAPTSGTRSVPATPTAPRPTAGTGIDQTHAPLTRNPMSFHPTPIPKH